MIQQEGDFENGNGTYKFYDKEENQISELEYKEGI